MSGAIDEFMGVLMSGLEETGVDLQADLADVRLYASEQLAVLALAVGEPGYAAAVIAARDNVLMKMGLSVVSAADAADNRIIGIVQGALALGAKVIAGGAL